MFTYILAAVTIALLFFTAVLANRYSRLKTATKGDLGRLLMAEQQVRDLLDERDDSIAHIEALVAEADCAAQALRIQSARVESLEEYSAHGKELLRYAAKQLGTDVAALAQQYDSANRKFQVFHLDSDGFEI